MSQQQQQQQQQQQPSNSSSSALVSTRQRPVLLRLLSIAIATRTLVDLRRYLLRGGAAKEIVYSVLDNGVFLIRQEDNLGPSAVKALPLISVFCADYRNLTAHISVLLSHGADADGRGMEDSPLICCCAQQDTQIFSSCCLRQEHL